MISDIDLIVWNHLILSTFFLALYLNFVAELINFASLLQGDGSVSSTAAEVISFGERNCLQS